VQALDGIRVLDFTQMMLGPYATQMLGDLGADVIKVERPNGEWERSLELLGGMVEGESAAFLAMNRNKRSVALDLTDARARTALLRLAATSDVVVENFRPGVLDRLGLGYEDIRAVKPDIIYCSGSGWGRSTAAARENRPGQDLLVQGMSGIAAANGMGGGPPVNVATSVVDHATALTLACSILAAIVARSTHGIGQRVEVDLYSTAIAMQCQEISALVNQGHTDWKRSPSGLGAPWLSAPFGTYRAVDGWLVLAMAPVELLAAVFDTPALVTLDAWDDRERVREVVASALAERTVAEWLETLLPAGLWAARVRTTREAIDELRADASDLLITTSGPDGPIELVGLPIRLEATPWQLRLPPPRVGEHTRELLAEVLTHDELMDLGVGL
jgi:crotonobetainyl-CoA:carnitine CoA-transferase CaiB-like acyl-CoA transferase